MNEPHTTPAAVVELPDGCRHYKTILTALSWPAWDALTFQGGWKDDQWSIDPSTKKPVPDGTPGAEPHRQKERRGDGQSRIVVFPPVHGRPEHSTECRS